MIIAIDGPAASGKGTIARQIASVYGLHYLDTGLLYRAVARAVLDAGHSPDDVTRAIEAAVMLDPSKFDDSALKTQAVTEAASVVAAIPEVRQALINYQRGFATKPPGAVLDGRDIGTVIMPDAAVKLFVTASLETRAMRRLRELQDRGVEAELDDVLADMRARDALDAARAAAPLRPAPDAVTIDTTELDAEATFARALDVVLAAQNRQ